MVLTLAGAMLGMLFIMYRKYEAYRSSLVKAFYRDGIGYFVCLSGEGLDFVLSSTPCGRSKHSGS